MTTALDTAVTAEHATVDRGHSLTGTMKLLWFMLRRDRIRFPAWVLAMTAMLAYFSSALGTVLDDQGVATFAAFAANPVMALVGGPGYGFDDITVGRLLVGLYGGYLMIGAALMSILTVSRHTRVEEQTGRAELVRANVVGRHAQLAAALAITIAMNVVMSLLMAAVFYASPADPGSWNSSLLFTLSIGAVGLVFAGVAAVTMQLSSFSRAASGIAGAVLATGFVLRGLGDMSRAQNGNLAWLSWLSPLGWSQHTAPLTLDRWWPLVVSTSTAVLLVTAGFALQPRRDLAAGIMADRPGPGVAPRWLRSPLSLAFRLQRTTIIWWSLAMVLAGITFGLFVQPMAENSDGMPEEILAVFGGADGMVDGYLGFMGIYYALMVAVFTILAVHTLWGEEQHGRIEPVLTTGTSRRAWITSWAAVTVGGSLWLLSLAGLGNGVGAALSMGDPGLIGRVLLGQVAHVPAVWTLLGVALLAYGLAPRLIALTWVVYLYSGLLSLFGDMIGLDDAVLATSVFRHIGQYPAEPISWAAVVILTTTAAVLTGLGVVGFTRRDLVTS